MLRTKCFPNKKISMRLIRKEDVGLLEELALPVSHLIPLLGLIQGFSSVSTVLSV